MTVIRAAAVAAALLAVATLPATAERDTTLAQSPDAAVQNGQVSDTTVRRAGMALRQVATIREGYMTKAQSSNSPQERRALSEQAEAAMMKAIGDQGLSVEQYNEVVQMAQADPALKQRLVSAAQSTQ